jgi:magnesium transporter
MRRHHPETAAQHLTAAVARAHPDDLVGDVRSRLAGQELEDTELVCVVDQDGRLLGLVGFAELFRLPADTALDAVMRRAPPAVQAHEDQEKVASLALHYGLNSVPVVDAGRRPSEGMLPDDTNGVAEGMGRSNGKSGFNLKPCGSGSNSPSAWS